jgi:transposase-like protein
VSTGILPPGSSNMSGYGLLKKAREKFPNCPEKSNWMSHISVAKERVCERLRFSYNKQIVFGILELKGNTRTVVADDVSAQTLMKEIQDHTKKGCVYYTDQFRSYNSFSRFGKHLKIDHSSEFKRGNYNPINGIEGFWSYAKKFLVKYHGVSRKNFPLYLKEIEWRFNGRKTNNLFEAVRKLL